MEQVNGKTLKTGYYFPLLLFAFIAGGFASSSGGSCATLRGGILAMALAGALPVINRIKVEKGFVNPLAAGMIGAFIAMLGGILILILEYSWQIKLAFRSMYQQDPHTIIPVAMAYGFAVHWAYASRQHAFIRYRLVMTAMLVAFTVVNCLRMGPMLLHFPGEVIAAGIGNSTFYVLFLSLLFYLLDPFPYPPRRPISKTLNRGLALMVSLIWLFAIGATMSIENISQRFWDKRFQLQYDNPYVLTGLTGQIFGDRSSYYDLACREWREHKIEELNCYNLYDVVGGTAAVLQQNRIVFLYRLGSDNVFAQLDGNFVAVAISPDESKVALLETKQHHSPSSHQTAPTRIVVYQLRTGEELMKTDYRFAETDLCWTKDGLHLIAESEIDLEQHLVELSLSTGECRDLGKGSWPRLAHQSGDIAFFLDNRIMKMKPDYSGRKEMLDLDHFNWHQWKSPLSAFIRRKWHFYDISPDGNSIVLTIPANTYYGRYQHLFHLVVARPTDSGVHYHILKSHTTVNCLWRNTKRLDHKANVTVSDSRPHPKRIH